MRTRATLAVRLVTRVTRVTRVDIPKTLQEWEQKWQMAFNADKCEVMISYPYNQQKEAPLF